MLLIIFIVVGICKSGGCSVRRQIQSSLQRSRCGTGTQVTFERSGEHSALDHHHIPLARNRTLAVVGQNPDTNLRTFPYISHSVIRNFSATAHESDMFLRRIWSYGLRSGQNVTVLLLTFTQISEIINQIPSVICDTISCTTIIF